MLNVLLQVKTGEEEEEAVFCHRAKLYRFDNNQWKERGLGEMKLLKHKENGNNYVYFKTITTCKHDLFWVGYEKIQHLLLEYSVDLGLCCI